MLIKITYPNIATVLVAFVFEKYEPIQLLNWD